MRHRSQQPSALRSLARPLSALWVAVALGACGNVTAGGVTGEAEVYMSGDADGSAPAAASSARAVDAGAPDGAPSPAHGSPSGVIVGAGLEGDVQVTATLYLRTAGGSLVELTPQGPFTVTLDLRGAQEPRVATAVVAGGIYAGLRIVFTDVVADVTAGLEIGGVPFTGAVSVDLGGDGIVVDRDVALTIAADQSVALLVDLRSDVWLDLLDPIGRTVGAADFAGAVEVSVR